MGSIRIAIIGLGNCASSLIQGIEYYRHKQAEAAIGLMHWDIGGYKVAFIRIEGKLFGDVPMNLEMRLSVEDSPNSAGVVIDAIRCCKLSLDRGIGGVLKAPSAYFMKHPPEQFTDDEAYQMTELFIKQHSR